MNKRNFRFFSIFLIVMVLLLMGASNIIMVDLGGLKSKDKKERENTANLIRKNQKEMIQKLIEYAGEKVNPISGEYPHHDSKHLSIILLGDLRAIEAMPVLIDNLEYENTEYFSTLQYRGMPTTADKYPAVESLIKIGLPAVDPVIKKMASYDKEGLIKNHCVVILNGILDVRLAREKLKISIDESKDPIFKRNLENVLPLFKTKQEKFAEELAERKKSSSAKSTDVNKPK